MTSANVDRPELKTTKVTGRRDVHYESPDDLLADARKLAAGSIRPLGNWTPGQILQHLALAIEGMLHPPIFQLPAPARFIMRLLMKKRMLTKPLPPGFKLPKKAAAMLPQAVPFDESLAALEKAVEHWKQTSTRGDHPAFGKLTADEWDQFQLRHCEMHMSFLVPDQGT